MREAMTLKLKTRRFTVGDYHRMAEAGILSEDDRVELIEGEIIETAPIGGRHVGLVHRLTHLFVRRFGDAAVVSVQNPVRLNDRTEPQPDLMLLHHRADFYAAVGLPTSEDVLLLVEVADTTAEVDRRVKIPLYARSGIGEVWLVDVEREVITVYRDPAPDSYHTSWTAQRGGSLAPLAFPGREIAATDIFGEVTRADT